jgi:hypothetical protein
MTEKKLPPYKQPTNFREFIQQICLRPAMYAGTYDFYKACIYIEGYNSALLDHKPEAIGQADLRGFYLWLAHKYGESPSIAWIGTIRNYCNDDESAFEQLPILLDEYINQLTDQES